MIHLDHISISAKNLYDSSHKLRIETGLGFYDGGFFAAGASANKIFPLGGSVYIEVGGIVDPFALAADPKRKPWWWDKVAASGDCFTGLCLRVDTMDELHEIGKRIGKTVGKNPVARTRPDGTEVHAFSVPSATDACPKGLPNWYCFEEFMKHPSGQPVGPGPALVRPAGVAWLEVGGTEAEMTKWLGVPAADFLFRFNGKSAGLYAVAVKSEKGEIVIRRKCATEV